LVKSKLKKMLILHWAIQMIKIDVWNFEYKSKFKKKLKKKQLSLQRIALNLIHLNNQRFLP